jgi:hypothetical protein
LKVVKRPERPVLYCRQPFGGLKTRLEYFKHLANKSAKYAYESLDGQVRFKETYQKCLILLDYYT